MQPVDFALPCAFLALVFALGEAVVRRPQGRNLVLGGVFLGFALTLLHPWLLLSGRMRAVPQFFESSLPAMFFVGPLVYAYFRDALQNRPVPRGKLALHLLPGILAALFCLPYFLQSAEQKLMRLEGFYAGRLALPGALLFPAGLAHLVLYMSWTAREVASILNLENLSREGVARAVLLFLGLTIAACLLAMFAIASGQRWLLPWSVNLAALNAPLIYLIQRRYPQFLNDLEELLRRARERERYRKSRLTGIDLADLEARLERSMRDERAYAREDLALPALAAELDVSPHQLSEYINDRLGVNFAGFVNGHRVEAAKTLLLADPKRTVLSVAYEVGFNSKTAFNDAFARHAGETPGQFRKKSGT